MSVNEPPLVLGTRERRAGPPNHPSAGVTTNTLAEARLRRPARVYGSVRTSAATDALTDFDAPPDDEWGFGKLRAYAAVAGGPPAPAEPWRVLELVAQELEDCEVALSVTGEVPDSALARWDLDYDGTWDTDFVALQTRPLELEPGEAYAVRVDVASGGWMIGGAAITGNAAEDCSVAADTTAGESSASGDAGSASATDEGSSSSRDEADGSGTGEQASSSADGCGCAMNGPSSAMPILLVLLAARRRSRTSSSGPRTSTLAFTAEPAAR